MKKILCFFLPHRWHRVIRKTHQNTHPLLQDQDVSVDYFKCLRCPKWTVVIK